MLTLTRELTDGEIDLAAIVTGTLTLPFEARQCARQRTRLDDGREVALALPRGAVLRQGSVLADDGDVRVFVRAAREALSIAHADDPRLLARACYLLGNRHAPLQIGEGWIAWQRDPRLDELVRDLGLLVTATARAFVPEPVADASAAAGQSLAAQGEGCLSRARHELVRGERLPEQAMPQSTAMASGTRQVATVVVSTAPPASRTSGGRAHVPVRAAAQWW